MGIAQSSMQRCKPGFIFVTLTLFFFSITVAWLRLDRSAPTWDDAYYLTRSIVLFDSLADGGIPLYAKRFLQLMNTKPPLVAALPTPVYLLAGRKFRAAYSINLVFLFVIFFSLYRMGKRYARPGAGLFAVFVVGTMPMVYSLSRWFLVECGLTAMVCAAMCLITEWDDSYSPLMASLLGVICGLGVLLKASFPAYVLVPLLWFAVGAHRSLLRPSTLAALGVPVILIAGPWYAVNATQALRTALNAGSAKTATFYGTGEIFSARDIWNYLVNVANAAPILYVVAAALLALAARPLIKSEARRGLLLCALWAVPLALFTFSHYRDLRYAAPCFPALALALGILADVTIQRYGRMAFALLLALLTLPLLSMMQTSFGIPSGRPLELGGLLFVQPRLGYAQKYRRVNWSQPQILADIARLGSFQDRERKLLVVANDEVRFNADNFQLAAAQERLPFDIATTAYKQDLVSLLSLVDSAAYFIYREGGEPQGSPFNTLGPAAIDHVRGSSKFRELPIATRLPDGAVVHVFANAVPGRSRRSGAFLRAGLASVPTCRVTFDDKLQLTGFSMARTLEGLEVRYRWHCLRPLDRDYWCFTHILNDTGQVIGYLDHPILNGDPPMSEWNTGDEAIETLVFPLPQAESGKKEYRVRLGLFQQATGDRLRITASDFPLDQGQTAAMAR